ncbi:MAG: ester cyclase [Sphingobacteriales bacterium]|nr:ester cyclase [Sphingobacteriales bacterium]
MKKVFFAMAAAAFLLAACNNEKKNEEGEKEKTNAPAESMAEKNKQTALASVNALLAGDVAATLKDGAADVTDYGDGSMPPVKGMDSLKLSLQRWRDAVAVYKADNQWAIAEGDYVAVFADWTITFKTDFMGMKTAGKTVKLKDADIFKFNSEGKITEHRNVQSSAEMMKQIMDGGMK